jgi:subtilisin family serine protease
MPFPTASGRGVKVAVIDSGVNAAHPHILGPVKTIMLGAAHSGGSQEDRLGHGTAVTAAIQEKAPDAEYFAVKLFGSSLRATTSLLIEAIEWAVENRMDVINLSLGTGKIEARERFQALVDRARSAGSVLVSARVNNLHPMLPGSLPQVIGVDVDWNVPRNRYRIETTDGSCAFFASGYPRSLPGVPRERNLNGISFAVANMSGFVARACELVRVRSFDTICSALAAEISSRVPESSTSACAVSE